VAPLQLQQLPAAHARFQRAMISRCIHGLAAFCSRRSSPSRCSFPFQSSEFKQGRVLRALCFESLSLHFEL
jgi:hypothetical protein